MFSIPLRDEGQSYADRACRVRPSRPNIIAAKAGSWLFGLGEVSQNNRKGQANRRAPISRRMRERDAGA